VEKPMFLLYSCGERGIVLDMSDPVEIKLPCGMIAMVSAEDWPRVSKLSWCNKGGGYGSRFLQEEGRRGWQDGFSASLHSLCASRHGRMVSLHRFILSAPADMVVDHIDGNPLNNTRGNLQIVTQSRNCMKRRDVLGGGVQEHRGRWRVRISIDGKQRSFGTYATRGEATIALEAARRTAWELPTNAMEAAYQ
jgi:hypothetical protein